jgi:2-polyprenyl-6-methoxyphenol hydroxylase-like FAD-dependent oxidoreductase
MSPARGSGANTALMDAGLLCRTLTAAAADSADVVAAIGDYERQMRESDRNNIAEIMAYTDENGNYSCLDHPRKTDRPR